MDFPPEVYDSPRREVQVALLMLGDGYTLVEVAKQLGVPRITLYYWLHPDRDHAARNIDHCSRCGRAMAPYLKSERKRAPLCHSCSQARDEEIVEMWNAGMSRSEIAEVLGWEPSRVSSRVSRLRWLGYDMGPLRKRGNGARPAKM